MKNATTNAAPGFASHPGYTISISPNPGRLSVKYGGKTIAESDQALVLHEGSYQAVYYVPRNDVDMAQLMRTDHRTHCPFKGEASYWTLSGAGNEDVNAAWSYETPFDEMLEIKDFIAFDRNKVEIG